MVGNWSERSMSHDKPSLEDFRTINVMTSKSYVISGVGKLSERHSQNHMDTRTINTTYCQGAQGGTMSTTETYIADGDGIGEWVVTGESWSVIELPACQK